MKTNILTLIAILSITINAFAEETINITNGEWEPYNSQYSPHYGLFSHVITEAFALEGVKVKYGFFPWARAMDIAKAGEKWHGTGVWDYRPERAKFYYYSEEPVGGNTLVFFHLKSFDFDWNGVEDLKSIRIGGTLEYDYKYLLTAKEEGKIKIDLVPKDEQNFKKLLAGRIQIFPNSLLVGYAQIRNLFKPEVAAMFTHHLKPIDTPKGYLLLSKNFKQSPHFMELFNRGLKGLKESGRFKQMLADAIAGKYAKQETKWKEPP